MNNIRELSINPKKSGKVMEILTLNSEKTAELIMKNIKSESTKHIQRLEGENNGKNERVNEKLHIVDENDLKIVEYPPIGEYIPQRHAICDKKTNEPYIILYSITDGCQSYYNILTDDGTVRVASIETMIFLHLILTYETSNKHKE